MRTAGLTTPPADRFLCRERKVKKMPRSLAPLITESWSPGYPLVGKACATVKRAGHKTLTNSPFARQSFWFASGATACRLRPDPEAALGVCESAAGLWCDMPRRHIPMNSDSSLHLHSRIQTHIPMSLLVCPLNMNQAFRRHLWQKKQLRNCSINEERLCTVPHVRV